jgi:hypothetical protein
LSKCSYFGLSALARCLLNSSSVSEARQQLDSADKPTHASRWEKFVWPQWLPTRARLPLIAQITAGAAMVAALTMPAWSDVQSGDIASAPVAPVRASLVVPHVQPVAPQPPDTMRPAHLNLDVRHSFGSVQLSVTVDDERVLDTRLDGSRKRFGAFGKRPERGFTKTLDLEPGVRVVRVRVRSAEDDFDQTRVERFDLGSAAVASMRIAVDNSGLSIFADRPAPPPMVAQVIPAMTMHSAQPATSSGAAARSTTPSAAAELYQALRSMLIAVTGFIASAATGFVVQEFLRQRKRVLGLD